MKIGRDLVTSDIYIDSLENEGYSGSGVYVEKPTPSHTPFTMADCNYDNLEPKIILGEISDTLTVADRMEGRDFGNGKLKMPLVDFVALPQWGPYSFTSEPDLILFKEGEPWINPILFLSKGVWQAIREYGAPNIDSTTYKASMMVGGGIASLSDPDNRFIGELHVELLLVRVNTTAISVDFNVYQTIYSDAAHSQIWHQDFANSNGYVGLTADGTDIIRLNLAVVNPVVHEPLSPLPIPIDMYVPTSLDDGKFVCSPDTNFGPTLVDTLNSLQIKGLTDGYSYLFANWILVPEPK
jgi:hypothetical protein